MEPPRTSRSGPPGCLFPQGSALDCDRTKHDEMGWAQPVSPDVGSTNMKKITLTFLLLLGTLLALYVAFMCGRYSYLITEPEMFLSEKEEWAVEKARAYAIEHGIAEDRLSKPKVIDTVKVYFGGMAGTGNVEITMMKDNGQFLESRY